MKTFLKKGKSLLTPSQSSHSIARDGCFVTPPTADGLFPVVPDECVHDCDSCSVHYPAKFSIEEKDPLYGFGKAWDTHLLVGTGKTDWVRDVTDEKGSVMEAVGKYGEYVQMDQGRGKGKVRLSATNLPLADGEPNASTCLLLPAWQIIEKVTPADIPALMEQVIAKSASNQTLLRDTAAPQIEEQATPAETNTNTPPSEEDTPRMLDLQISNRSSTSKFNLRHCPHRAVILMCSQKTRDARCGISAPLLKKEFERLLRPLGLYRDSNDDRPGGVGIYFISHVGGHKYSANVIIYRRQGAQREGSEGDFESVALHDEAVQCIWLARVRPEDCENIVNYTVLQGKVMKPHRQLRGGFDRERGVLSW